MPGRRLSFGPFEVDGGAQLVLRDGAPLAIGARGVRLLEALLRRPGEVLTKAELMDAAWPGTAVEESNLSVQMAALRKALRDATGDRDWIATVPRVGYRFVGAAGTGAAGPEPSRDDRRALAVLPFVNLSSDAEQAFFADGLAEEIITALSRLPGLLVIARNSSFAFRGDGIDLRHVGRELDVQYVVTGSVRRSGDRVRMGVQLAEAETATQLWAETYDRQLTDVFSVQDDVTRQVVAALGSRLAPERPSASGPPMGTERFEALDLFLRARGLLYSPTPSRESNAAAIALLHEALDLDAAFGRALTMLTVAHCTARSSQWADDPVAEMVAAREAADRAMMLIPDDVEAHGARALVAMLEKDHERLRSETELAITLGPDNGLANILRGGFLVNDGLPLQALPFYEKAIRVDPGMSHMYVHHLATAYLAAKRYETAAALYRSRIRIAPRTDMSRGYLCIALGYLGLREEAHRVWAELMEINPSYSLTERLTWWHYRNPEDAEHLLEGLRRAGLPTGETTAA